MPSVSEAYLEKHQPGMSRLASWKDKEADAVIGKVFEGFGLCLVER